MLPARDRVIRNARVTMTGDLVGTVEEDDDNDGPTTRVERDSYDDSSTSEESSDTSSSSDSFVSNLPEGPQEATVATLISRRHYSWAVRRLHRNPEEAKDWIDSVGRQFARSDPPRMNPLRQNSWPSRSERSSHHHPRRRQPPREVDADTQVLPLHMACVHLSDEKTRADVEDLIRELVRVYPEACREPDLNGRIPLHEVMAWDASIGTISAVMMAYPEALYQRDSVGGCLPLDLVSKSRRTDQEQLAKILLEGQQAWEQSRLEAVLRFKLLGSAPLSANKDVSRSVLLLAEALEAEPPFLPSSPRSVGIGQNLLSHARRALEAIYDGNRVLAEAVHELLEEKTKNASRRDADPPPLYREQQIHDLEDENVYLKRALLRGELVLHDHGFDSSGNLLSVESSNKDRAMCMMSMDPEPPTVLTKYLETKVGELSEENDQLEAMNEELQFEVAALKQKISKLARGSPITQETKTGESGVEVEKETTLTLRIAELELALADAIAANETLEQERSFRMAASLSTPLEAMNNLGPARPHGGEEPLNMPDRSAPGVVATPVSTWSSGTGSEDPSDGISGPSGGGAVYDPGTRSDPDQANQHDIDESYRIGTDTAQKESRTSWGLLNVGPTDSGMANLSNATPRLPAVSALTTRMLEDDLVEALIETSERELHSIVPIEVRVALSRAAESFDSLLEENNDEEGNLVSIHLNFQDLDRMFQKAQEVLGKPFSEHLIFSLRRACFQLESLLQSADLQRNPDPFGQVEQEISNLESKAMVANPSQSSSTGPHSARTHDVALPGTSGMVESRMDESRATPANLKEKVSDSDTHGANQTETILPLPTTDYEVEEDELEESSVDISVSLRTEATHEVDESQEFDQIIESAREILGRDISPQMIEALRLLSQASEQSRQKDESIRPPPIRIRSGVGKFSASKNAEDDDDEIKSILSKQSEMSLNLSAVFMRKGPSELERQLKNLENSKRTRSALRQNQLNTSDSLDLAHILTQTQRIAPSEPSDSRDRPRYGGVLKVKSGEVNLSSNALSVTSSTRRARIQGHQDATTKALMEGDQGISLVKLAEKSGTDNLQTLLRHAATEVEENESRHSLSHNLDGANGAVLLRSILLETEATHGIEVPGDIGAALEAAMLDSFQDPDKVPFILIIQSLHDEDIISDAAQRAGREIPNDLIKAIRSTSLAAGVSVESLRALDSSSSVLPTKKYNTSAGSMAYSLGLTDSSGRSTSTRSTMHPNDLRRVTVEALRHFDGSSTKRYDSSTEPMNLSFALTDSSRRSRSTHSSFLRSSTSNRASTQVDNFSGAREGSTSSRLPPIDTSRRGTSRVPTLSHSDKSSGKPSASKSPASKNRQKKETKKYRKGTKDAMFERAQKRKEQVAALMIRLADFGGPTDDLQPLFERAQETIKAERRSLAGLRGTTPTGEGGQSSGFIDSIDYDNYDSITSAIPNPDGSQSCIATSPQESELDMLLARFCEIAGRPLPLEIDLALRKASRSMDSSLDMVSKYASLSEHRRFGTKLTAEKLDFIYGEAEIFLGREIDVGILDTLIRAARDLLELEEELSASIQKFSASYASIISMEFSVARDMADSSTSTFPEAPLANTTMQGLTKNDVKDDELQAIYRAAIDRSQMESASPTLYTIHGSGESILSPDGEKLKIVLHGAENYQQARTQVRSKASLSPSKPEGNSELVHTMKSIRTGTEMTEIEKKLSLISPMTDSSDYTSVSNVSSTGSRLGRKLSTIPSLADSDLDFDYEEDYLNPSENLDDDSKNSERFGASTRQVPDDVSHYSGRLYGQHGEHESLTYPGNASITSEELNAIISQAQDEYGMELPPELVEALKTASTESLNDGESLAASNVSSFFTQHTGTEIDEASEFLELMKFVRKNLADSDDQSIQYFGKRWKLGEYLAALFNGVGSICGALPEDLHDELWESFSIACSRKDNVALSTKEVYELMAQFSKDTGRNLSLDIVTSFLKSAYDLVRSGSRLSDHLDDANSEVGSSEGRGSVHDHYLPSSHLNTEAVHRNTMEPRIQNSFSTSMQSSELRGARLSGSSSFETSSDLEYSMSESINFGSNNVTNSSKQVIPSRQGQRSAAVASIPEEEGNGVLSNGDSQGVEQFISEVEKEYGQPLPQHVLLALKQISVRTGLSSSTDSSELWDTKSAALGSLSLELPPELASAIQRATERKTSSPASDETMPPLRSFSSISALTGYTGATGNHSNASSEWTTEDDPKEKGNHSNASSEWTTEDDRKEKGNLSSTSSEWNKDDGQKENCDNTDTPERPPENERPMSSIAPHAPPPPPPPSSPPPPLLDGLESLTSGSLTSGSLSSASSRNRLGRSLLKSVKEIYKRTIPKELSTVLTRSHALPSAKNTDEEIQIILAECEDLSGKRLPADLVLALREASVKLRAPPSTLRRSKLNRQVSASQSRSSGMPSIQEWEASTATDIKAFLDYKASDFQVDRVPSSFGPLSIPKEIAAEERSSMDVSSLKDSDRTDGTSMKSTAARLSIHATTARAEAMRERGSKDESDSSERKSNDKVTTYSHTSQRLSVDANVSSVVRNDSTSSVQRNRNGSSTDFSISESIKQWKNHIASNVNTDSVALIVSKTTGSGAYSSRIKTEGPTVDGMQNADKLSESKEHSSHPLSVSTSSVESTGSSTSTEVTRNNSPLVSTSEFTNVSRASSLTTCKLPIGVHAVPPLEGVETDDLSAIFKEAAKRFS